MYLVVSRDKGARLSYPWDVWPHSPANHGLEILTLLRQPLFGDRLGWKQAVRTVLTKYAFGDGGSIRNATTEHQGQVRVA